MGVVGVDFEHGAEAASDFGGDVDGERVVAGAGLGDGAVEEAFGLGCAEQDADAHTAGGFAEDGDVVGVAAEAGDVVAHPAQGGDLVAHTVVAAVGVVAVGQGGVVEEAERAEAVVDGDDDDIAAAGEVLAVVDRGGAGAGGEAAAVDPDHHGALCVVKAGGPDVEREAVFGDGLFPGAEQFEAVDEGLHGAGAELVGFAHAAPGLRFAGGAPAEVALGRGGVGDAAEDGEVVFLLSGELSVAGGDGGRHGELLTVGRWDDRRG